MQNSLIAPLAVANALLNGVAAAKGTSALERYGRHDHLMKRWDAFLPASAWAKGSEEQRQIVGRVESRAMRGSRTTVGFGGTGEGRHAEPSAPIDKKYSSPAADLHATTLMRVRKTSVPPVLRKI
jgi:hypothetical protein